MNILTILLLCSLSSAFSLQMPLRSTGGSGSEIGGPIPGNAQLHYCHPGQETGDSAGINLVDLSPFPPIPGQNLTITASGYLNKPIYPGSYVQVQVKLGWVTLIDRKFDLCEQSERELDLKCPIPRGPMAIVKEVSVPEAVPPGKIKVRAESVNEDGSPISCFVGEVQFR